LNEWLAKDVAAVGL